MLQRLTISALLRSVIGLMATRVVAIVSINLWGSWQQVRDANQIAAIADASADVFKSMHNVRADRTTTLRTLNGELAIDSQMETYIQKIRDSEMPSLRSATAALAMVDFADQ